MIEPSLLEKAHVEQVKSGHQNSSFLLIHYVTTEKFVLSISSDVEHTTRWTFSGRYHTLWTKNN